MQVRHRTPRRNRNAGDPSQRFTGSDAIATPTINAGNARLTFNQPVQVIDLPALFTVQGLAPTAVHQVSATVVDLTYAAAVVVTNVLNIPSNVPQIRTPSGGYVAARQFTF